MKKKLNVIQIKGIKGLIIAGMVVSCLIAGFIAFPGWVWMNIWNIVALQTNAFPTIGLMQGVLLWAIILTAYFIFRKEKVVVCVKTPQGLNEEELKSVMADLKKQATADPILQAMLKAREAELKYKEQSEKDLTNIENPVETDSNKI